MHYLLEFHSTFSYPARTDYPSSIQLQLIKFNFTISRRQDNTPLTCKAWVYSQRVLWRPFPRIDAVLRCSETMRLLLVLMIVSLSECSSNDALVSEVMSREHVNTVVLLQCNSPKSADLFRDFSGNFTGYVFNVGVDSSRFFDEHRRLMSVQYSRLGVIVNFTCEGIYEIFELASSSAYFNASYEWLIFVEDRLDSAVEILGKQNVNVDSRITLVSEEDIIYDVYNTIHRRKGQLIVTQIGTWNSSMGADWTCNTNSYGIRKNLRGIILWSAASTLNVPRNVTLREYLQDLEPARRYAMDRYGYRLTQLISHHLNIRVNFILTKTWGLDIVGKNSSKGTIGQLQKNLVDFSSVPLAYVTDRIGIYEQTGAVTPGQYLTIFRHPRNTATKVIFLQPFDNWLWIAVGILLSVAALALMLAFFCEHSPDSKNAYYLLLVLGFFCQQGNSINATFGSSRIAIFTVLLFSLMIYQFYATFIIGYLLILPPKTIKTLEQLLASDLKYSIEDNAFNHIFFNVTNNPTAIKLYQKKILPNEFAFVNVSTGLSLVKRGGYAFHCELSYSNTYIRDTFEDAEICDLQEMKLYGDRPQHLVLPKGSPLKELFRVTIRRLLETGVAQYYMKKFYIEKPRCLDNSQSSVQVEFRDVASLFWVLAWALFAGFLMLMVEIVVFRIGIFFEMRRIRGHYPVWVD